MRPMGDANDLPSAVEEAARRLARATEAESIILFGSRARGDWRDDSDWDLCVILPDGSRRASLRPLLYGRSFLASGFRSKSIPCGAPFLTSDAAISIR